MLATCNRCQKRKIKCDSLLPGCRSCTQAGIDCTFYDHGGRANIQRSYIAQLDERVRHLRDQLKVMNASPNPSSKVKNRNGSAEAVSREISTPAELHLPFAYFDGSFNDPHQLRVILRSPNHGFSNIFLGAGTAATIGSIVVNNAVKAGLKGIVDTFAKVESDIIPQITPHVEASRLDRSIVELNTVRDLISNHYIVKIHPIYPVVDMNDLKMDITRLTRIPTRRRFVILMSAAISAACLSRKHPIMYNKAIILRDWADELAITVLADPGAPRLQEVLLLILYELVDPTRRLIWNLLGLACRMCVKLGWHRNAGAIAPAEPGDKQIQILREQERRTVLFIVLYELERRVCQTLGRPTILPDVSINLTLLPQLQELNSFHALFTQSQLQQKIYEASFSLCPFSAEIVELINQLDHTPQCDASWLLLYPIQQHACNICTTAKRWEQEIEQAAISRVNYAYEMHQARRILSVWLEAAEVFVAGAILVDLRIRHRFLPHADARKPILKSATRCMSLLASFAESWPAGEIFSHLFEKLLEAVPDSSGIETR